MGHVFMVKERAYFSVGSFCVIMLFATDRRTLAKKLDGLSKPVLQKLIISAGLKSKDERLLLAWYLEEKCIYQIAADEHVQKESAYNAIASARNRLYEIITNQKTLMPDDIQNIIEYLLNCEIK